MKIGVLSLQGDFQNHINLLNKLKVANKEVRYNRDFDSIDGLIIPGGESTTMSTLIESESLYETISNFITSKPVYGTCAGLILLSSNILSDDKSSKCVKSFNLLDLTIKRNGWGRQIDSFVSKIKIESFKDDFEAIFIRAPKIISSNNVEILSSYSGSPVMIKAGNVLGTTFHPELTQDLRIHQYFLEMVRSNIEIC